MLFSTLYSPGISQIHTRDFIIRKEMHNAKNISKFNKNQSAFYLAAKHYVNVKVIATNTTIPQGDRTLLKRPCSSM